MTSAQDQCLATIMQSNQSLNLAETGSGKTLMYLLPIINEYYNARNQSKNKDFKFWSNPKGALILTSSKELCTQIYRDLKELDADDIIKATRLGSLSMIAPIVRKSDEIKKTDNQEEISNRSLANYVDFDKMDVVISTPVQLERLLEAKRIKRLNPKFIVIDEADHLMTDFKNVRVLSKILDLLNVVDPSVAQSRKVILMAATFPSQIKKNSMETYLEQYFPNLQVTKSANYLHISPDIDHSVVDVEGLTFSERCLVCKEVLSMLESKHFIVFCNSNSSVRKLVDFLTENDIPCQAHHADQSEPDRMRAMNLFSTGEFKVLVCSDTINRGVHFDFPLHMVQFEPALNVFSLIHRIGRTGRLGRQPLVTSFIDSSNRSFLGLVQGVIGKNN